MGGAEPPKMLLGGRGCSGYNDIGGAGLDPHQRQEHTRRTMRTMLSCARARMRSLGTVAVAWLYLLSAYLLAPLHVHVLKEPAGRTGLSPRAGACRSTSDDAQHPCALCVASQSLSNSINHTALDAEPPTQAPDRVGASLPQPRHSHAEVPCPIRAPPSCWS